MATPTYTPLATFTATGTETSVTFGSIPSSYRDIVIMGRVFQSGISTLYCRFNSDSGSNYHWINMLGDGTSATTASLTTSYAPIWYSGNPTDGIIHSSIMDYSATDRHKTMIGKENSDGHRTGANASRWANTAAITTIEVISNTKTFQSGTTISIYGIAS